MQLLTKLHGNMHVGEEGGAFALDLNMLTCHTPPYYNQLAGAWALSMSSESIGQNIYDRRVSGVSFLQDSELLRGVLASPAEFTATRTWRERMSVLLGFLCGGARRQPLGSMSGGTNDIAHVRTSASSRVADTGGLLLTQLIMTGDSLDSELYSSIPRAYSASGTGSLSMLLLRSRRRNTLVSCTSSSQLQLTRTDSAWSSEGSGRTDKTCLAISLPDTDLLQLHPFPTQACITQSTSFPARQLCTASYPSMHRTEPSADPIPAAAAVFGEHPEFQNTFPDCLDLIRSTSDPGNNPHYRMQPYDEEKRTWLQMKWQQQQDWLEEQQQVHPFSPRQQMRQRSRSLNVQAAKQSGVLLVEGFTGQARTANPSLSAYNEEGRTLARKALSKR